MVKRLKTFFAPPTFATEEENRIAGMLNIILLTFLIATLVIMLVMLWNGTLFTVVTLLATFVAIGFCYGLMRRGYLQAAGVGALFVLLLTVGFILYAGFGVHDPAILLLPIVIIVAGLVLDTGFFMIFTGLSVLAVAFIILLEVNGFVEKAIFTRDSKGLEFIIYTTILIITAVTVRILSQNLKDNLARARQSESRWRSLVANAPDMILNVTADGVIEFINLPDHDNSESVLGKTIYDFTHPDYHPVARQTLSRVYQSGVPGRFESLVLNEKNEYGWFVTQVAPMRLEETVMGLTLIATDISDRREMELALQTERDFAQLIITNMGQGLALTDTEGKFIFANPAYCTITGYTSDEIVGKTPFDLVTPETIPQLLQQREIRQSGETTAYESLIRHKDGRDIHVLITGVPRWQDGKVIGSIAVITDLTEQKEAALERERLIMELEARNAELERFTYTVSHDLKSPLVTIKGFLGLLEKDLAVDDKQGVRQSMARIYHAAKTMERLLADLLELSRVGRLINPPEIVPFNQIVAEALALVGGYLENRDVTIKVAPDLPDVFVDRMRMVEAMQNLLDNALKFTVGQPEAIIEVGTEKRGGEVLFFVRDNGCGIDSRYHEQVFGLFERLDAAVEGTGIGLALVKRIIGVHNGRIWVESGGVDAGSTFYFTLPLPDEQNGAAGA